MTPKEKKAYIDVIGDIILKYGFNENTITEIPYNLVLDVLPFKMDIVYRYPIKNALGEYVYKHNNTEMGYLDKLRISAYISVNHKNQININKSDITFTVDDGLYKGLYELKLLSGKSLIELYNKLIQQYDISTRTRTTDIFSILW